MKIKECPFCKEAQEGLPIAFEQQLGSSTRTLRTTKEFFSFPSISPLGNGHVLICPKDHILSTATAYKLTPQKWIDYSTSCISDVESRFGVALIFEHGIGVGKEGGCGVSHAHLHVLAKEHIEQADVALGVEKTLGITSVFHQTLERALASLKADDSYLLLGTLREGFNLWVSDNIPSQTARKTIALLAGREYWDWKLQSDWPLARRNYESLKIAA